MNYDNYINKVINNSNIQPRDYQLRIINKTLDHFLNKGTKSVLIEAPCGAGKTIIALLIIKILQEFFQQNPDKKNFIHFSSTTEPPSSETTKICEANFRCGWVSMRKNLLTQVLQENINKGINADITTISMFEKNPPQVDFLCIDESQHDSVASMAHIYNVCQPKHILGITATPFRSDRVKLCFSTIIKDAGIGKLIHDGYLSPYEHYTIPKWSPETVCEFYLKDINRWGKSLFYFRHIKECYAAKEIFNRWGIDAEVVTSKTDKDHQIQDFIENKYNILINCNILTEGFNSPDLQSVWCRPAHTKGTVIQMCGRAFRIHPDIPHKNIIQCKKTKWPFIKTATPLNQFIWVDDEWRSLKPNPSIMVAQRAVVNAIRMIDVEMPKHIEKYKEKRAKIRRGSPRNRPLTSTI